MHAVDRKQKFQLQWPNMLANYQNYCINFNSKVHFLIVIVYTYCSIDTLYLLHLLIL